MPPTTNSACATSPCMASMTDSERLHRARGWLLLSVLVTLAPHLAYLPHWVAALAAGVVLLAGWRWRHGQDEVVMRWLPLVLCIAGGILVRLEFGRFFGKDPGIAMLALLLGFKLLELRAERDVVAAILLSYFLQLSVFLYDQSPVVALLALGGALMSTATLMALQTSMPTPLGQLRRSGLLFVQALPYLLVFFILFPRIPGPLWGLPADAHSGFTGLSDTMQPGSISNLSQSGEIAFRARFDGPPPPPQQRYWRGPVLTRFDGTYWRPMVQTQSRTPDFTPTGTAYRYQLTLEPHNQLWLLGLDYAQGAFEAARYGQSYELIVSQPVRNRARFEIVSYPQATVGRNEAPHVLQFALRIPATGNPRARALGQQLATAHNRPRDIFNAVLADFAARPLIYTLQPPLLPDNSVDRFLFDTQAGFCEHFASAFVFVMRAAGVPARVVTGYLGGEINPVDGVMVVRQSDAHAWAEVWLPDEGWVRADPTALVAPDRIRLGLADALPDGEPLPLMMRSSMRWLWQVRHQWEALSNRWNEWVIGYDQTRQRSLMRDLGFGELDWPQLTMAVTGAAMLLGGALMLWVYRPWQGRRDALERSWQRCCQRLARAGLQREPWEGPIDFGVRAARAFPSDAALINHITRRYARLRYGSPPQPDDIRAFAQLVARLHPQRKPPQPHNP